MNHGWLRPYPTLPKGNLCLQRSLSRDGNYKIERRTSCHLKLREKMESHMTFYLESKNQKNSAWEIGSWSWNSTKQGVVKIINTSRQMLCGSILEKATNWVMLNAKSSRAENVALTFQLLEGVY